MVNEIKFEDKSVYVKGKIAEAVIAWLNEASAEICSQAQRNSRVDTGQLKSSWVRQVTTSDYTAKVGSPLENAIWEEFGTGQYALEGNGRKKPWFYEDRHGKGHWTAGKKPQRTLYKAFKKVEPKAKKALEKKLKELG